MSNNYSWLNALIIDDCPSVALVCQQLLEEHYQLKNIQLSHSALDGIKKLNENHHINLLIIDLNMPDIDGIQLISALSDINYKGYLVIMSGASTQIIKSVEQLAGKNRLNLLGSVQKPLCQEAFDLLFSGLKRNTKGNSPKAEPLKIYEIIRAINNQDVIVHYQPLVCINSRKVVGVEALCRLEHPTKGLIPPNLFINIAEQSELIYHLTMQVINQSFAVMNEWHQQNIDLTLSVNISPALFGMDDFLEDLLGCCKQHNIPYEKVCIEITEDILSACDKKELEILSRLSLKGFSLSLDDFGTGHASIERLFNLPFQQIKIDKSVFTKSGVNDSNLIATTSAMTNRLDLELVIEGVETFKHWTIAKNNGVDIAQGYYISKPLSAEKLPKWIEHWTTQAVS